MLKRRRLRRSSFPSSQPTTCARNMLRRTTTPSRASSLWRRVARFAEGRRYRTIQETGVPHIRYERKHRVGEVGGVKISSTRARSRITSAGLLHDESCEPEFFTLPAE